MYYKYVIVGAGITGLTIAERIASELDEKVLVIEKRSHIGGNCYDCYNGDGILIHLYGPHIFHTQHREVWEYLSRFTDWNYYQHRVLTYVDGQLLPMPICAKTINALYNKNLEPGDVRLFLDEVRDANRGIRSSEDVVIAAAGNEIYEKFFKHYTKKQWDVYPDELDPSVISRVPIRSSFDDRYFTDRYQAMPRHGFSAMFGRMIANPNIKILLNTDYKEVVGSIGHGLLVCTTPIDYHYDYALGRLKYRSVDVRFETHDVEQYQSASVVNYPNDYDFTRITEYKKLTGQRSEKTTISLEFPTWEGDPYYPVPNREQHELYERYRQRAEAETNVIFAGRLGQFRYLNMDAAVKEALATYRRIAERP